MPKFRLVLAASFLTGGILVGFGFALLSALAGGPGDATLVFCIEAFFAFGLVASLPISILARRVLAVTAYLMLFLGAFYLHHISLPINNLATFGIFIIALIYLFCWIPLICLEI